MGAAVAVIVAKARARIVRHFTDAGAVAKNKAIAFAPSSGRIERRMFDRMVRFGALVETTPGHYWLDEKRFADFKTESLARVLGIIGVAGLAVAGAIAFGS